MNGIAALVQCFGNLDAGRLGKKRKLTQRILNIGSGSHTNQYRAFFTILERPNFVNVF